MIRMNEVGKAFSDLHALLMFHVLGNQLSIRNGNVRANLAGALVRLTPDRHDSADGERCDVDPAGQILRYIFGVSE